MAPTHVPPGVDPYRLADTIPANPFTFVLPKPPPAPMGIIGTIGGGDVPLAGMACMVGDNLPECAIKGGGDPFISMVGDPLPECAVMGGGDPPISPCMFIMGGGEPPIPQKGFAPPMPCEPAPGAVQAGGPRTGPAVPDNSSPGRCMAGATLACIIFLSIPT
jgi:hypothetical protein